MDEFFLLGNFKEDYGVGETIAHRMIRSGHDFSVDEIIQLGNSSTSLDDTLAHYMVEFRHKKFTFSEVQQLNKYTVDKKYRTLAHYMAERGHRFSEKQIELLGNPVCQDGKTIKNFMDEHEILYS